MSEKIKKIGPCTFILPQEQGMLVPGLIIAPEELIDEVERERSLDQVRNVAYLPGIVGYSVAMPDIHWGYGFPIGGVAAMDAEEGVISPGGVGYDINCGVRLAVAPFQYHDIDEHVHERLLKEIFRSVPSGVGHGHRGVGISDSDYRKLLTIGVRWSIEEGFGYEADLDHIESRGCISGADPDAVSASAKERGRKQIGSIGSGNHFVEIGEVQEIFLPEVASQWHIRQGQLYILIHSGSRGFGHQVCQDTLNTYMKQGFAQNLPDPQLVAAPIRSEAGRQYFKAMAAAANYAFNNRQQILHWVRQAFKSLFGIDPAEIRLIYDVCHNIAKFESHPVNGQERRLCVHRKGATRAFGPHSPELAHIFQNTGQPVLVPGDMGRASYILVGQGNPLTWSSSCHGAGRARSRVQSSKSWRGRNLHEYMHQQGVIVLGSTRTIIEEMPDAYKDVDLVVKAVEKAKLAARVARLRPRLVIKG